MASQRWWRWCRRQRCCRSFPAMRCFLADPVFDHAKVALIDDMARLGLPPGNPFFADGGPFAYYYLWHFGAAEVARLLGVSGWAADAGLTWFAAFAALAAMMGLAVWLSRRASAAPLAVLFAATRICALPVVGSVRCGEGGCRAVAARRLRGLPVSVGLGAAAHHLGSDGHGGDLPDRATCASSQRVDGRDPGAGGGRGLRELDLDRWLRVCGERARRGAAAVVGNRAKRALAVPRRAPRRCDHRGGGRRAVSTRPGWRGGRAQQRFADRSDAARGIRRRHPRLAAPLPRSARFLAGVSARRAHGNLHSRA